MTNDLQDNSKLDYNTFTHHSWDNCDLGGMWFVLRKQFNLQLIDWQKHGFLWGNVSGDLFVLTQYNPETGETRLLDNGKPYLREDFTPGYVRKFGISGDDLIVKQFVEFVNTYFQNKIDNRPNRSYI